jgi:putative glutamine amidotransferase
MTPRIGIPLCLDARGRWKTGRDYHYIDAAYARAIESVGATPVYLPLQAEPDALVELFEGLLLPGGDDLLPPTPYPSGVEFDPVAESQLRFDSALLSAAGERGKPVLAICYGMQLLALSAGGSLHYDIPTDLPEADVHQLGPLDGRHPVTIEPDSRLADALGVDSISVNSLHHQGVAEPGDEMRVCARAADGLIEAIERAGPRFCVGVQWHPEKLDSSDALFRAFVAACGPAQDTEY